MQDIALPVRLGPTTLTARIGAGGMGIVYYGLLGPTPVAVKVMRAELGDSPEFRARFRREIELMRRVRGVCTARVYAADPDWYPPYLATEFLAGPTLADWVLRNGPIVGPSLRTLALGLAEALLAVHRAGVVHRDLKPGNVLLTQAGPKVVDFGIADATDVTVLTRVGTPVGTPGYMSPEQLNGLDVVGPPADVFAWGCTVAYAATGRIPFGAGPTDAVLFRVRHDPPNLAGIPDDLGGLVDETLRKDASARPDAAELVRRLLRLLLGPDWASAVVAGGAPGPSAGSDGILVEGGGGSSGPGTANPGAGKPAPWAADAELTDAELARGVGLVLERHWPIRAYLPPPPPSAVPGSPGAAPAPAPSAVPAPPVVSAPPVGSAPPVQAAPPGMSGGPATVARPPVGPGALAAAPWPARHWPPPVGPPVGPLPVLGRPAPPMPPGVNVPPVPSMPSAAVPAGGPAPAPPAAPPPPVAPPPRIVGPPHVVAPAPRVPPPAGRPGPIGLPGIARPSAPPWRGWRARHGAYAAAGVVVGAALLVALLVTSSLLVIHRVGHGRDSPAGTPGSGGSVSVGPSAGGHLAAPGTDATAAPKAAPFTPPAAMTAAGRCRYWATAAVGPAAGLPPTAADVPSAPLTMIVVTNYGTLSAELDAAAAPCAVYALRHLAAARYYEDSSCPRETIGPAALVSVLQCGDPTGTGAGSPGFAYAAEHSAVDDFGPGTLAMAGTSEPDTNGAQFLISYADPTPQGLAAVAAHYTVIGRITGGLDVLDRLVGRGIEGGGSEGPPASGARIESISISG